MPVERQRALTLTQRLGLSHNFFVAVIQQTKSKAVCFNHDDSHSAGAGRPSVSLTILFHRVTNDYPTTTSRLASIELNHRGWDGDGERKGRYEYSFHWLNRRDVVCNQEVNSWIVRRRLLTICTVLYSQLPYHNPPTTMNNCTLAKKQSRTVDHFTPPNYSIRVIIMLSGL